MAKQVIFTDSAPRPIGPYSQAIKSNGFIFVSGQIPVDPATGTVTISNIHLETRLILDNISKILETAGSSIDKVVKFNCYLKDINDIKFVNEIFEERNLGALPARSCIQASDLPKNVRIEIDAIAEE
ncbi:MAG: Rid family detoxifying hydrolase [Candidatus Goldbacteria bacterium]|nr:Rid family detoxifying hydrolase [Candidatus Goldiibacteriota bacterium]HPD18042.1 Rid family detoxifying hydrolase [Candidatus Goldiibacteriota bacterium]